VRRWTSAIRKKTSRGTRHDRRGAIDSSHPIRRSIAPSNPDVGRSRLLNTASALTLTVERPSGSNSPTNFPSEARKPSYPRRTDLPAALCRLKKLLEVLQCSRRKANSRAHRTQPRVIKHADHNIDLDRRAGTGREMSRSARPKSCREPNSETGAISVSAAGDA
jgi:hypothetical protein